MHYIKKIFALSVIISLLAGFVQPVRVYAIDEFFLFSDEYEDHLYHGQEENNDSWFELYFGNDYFSNDYFDNDYADDFWDELFETAEPPPQRPNLPPPAFIPGTGAAIPARDISISYIAAVQHSPTTIFFVGTPTEPSQQVYTIVASSPITAVNRMLFEDNRLAIDISNSTTALSGALPVPPFLAVSDIRISQFTDNITRVVFDLEAGTDFAIEISPDRTTIFLTIHQHSLQDINIVAGEAYDLIVLSGIRPSALQVRPGQGNLRFYLTNTRLDITADMPVDGSFLSHAALSMQDAHIAVLDLTVPDFTAHTVFQLGPNETAIRLQAATYRNIWYCFDERIFRIPKSEGFTMHIEHATRFDLYHNHQFILWFPVDLMEHLGFGEKIIADALLRSLVIAPGAGSGSQLILHGNQVFALDLQENDNYYIINVMHPREKYSRIVILDPGHGGRFPGAVRDGIREADMNLAVTNKLLQLINNDGFIRAYTTRNTDKHFAEDIADDLRIRAEWGNSIGDIFISIHHNSTQGSHIHGIETYYRANIHDSFRLLTSRNLAEIMHRHKLAVLRSNDREVRAANFAVLRHSTLPSALLELGFMSNPNEFSRMRSSEFQWQAAQAIYHALLEAFLWVPSRY